MGALNDDGKKQRIEDKQGDKPVSLETSLFSYKDLFLMLITFLQGRSLTSKNIYFKFLVNNSTKMMKFGDPLAEYNKNLSSTAIIFNAYYFNRIA